MRSSLSPAVSASFSTCDTRARDIPTALASASPEWISPSARRRSKRKPRGVSMCLVRGLSKPAHRAPRPSTLEHAAANLVLLDRLEQRTEIAFAEALVALALD